MISAARKNGLVLGLFALAATALLAGTHELTKDRIEQQKEAQRLGVLNTMIPKASHDNDLYRDCTLVRSHQYLGTEAPLPAFRARKNGKPVAVGMETVAPDGYNGAINLLVGLSYPDGTVLGVEVLEHKETPGLGDKIERRKTSWLDEFTGKSPAGEKDPAWAVKKDGGQFDQFTGATITPRAVVRAVGNTVQYFRRNKDALFAAPSQCGGSQ
ncbi:electron transport complex subunit RsxG [Gallaecimonas kandeliae]|uniref:electron transport complex subunit RsxG n=1 Tax=Gallaecimonas kandeliae TaxID=3029055 RepID=UPI0026498204|nr:electron transport complex subunit RsxG [Gallaecimonas kandeliae]WKE67485.1 electron transport complex subunit RsxG [Gallaecimonas kandeliae]